MILFSDYQGKVFFFFFFFYTLRTYFKYWNGERYITVDVVFCYHSSASLLR